MEQEVGAQAYSTVANNKISAVEVISVGSGYTTANATISANSGTGAVVLPYISPIGGHGKDAVKELGGHDLMLHVNFNGSEENTVSTNNDFRMIGLVKNMRLTDGNVANATNYDLTTTLNTSNTVGTFLVDEQLIGDTSSATGTIVDIISNTSIKVIDVSGTFANAEFVSGNTSGASATITGINSSSVQKYTGELLYLNNTTKITRADDQQENIRITIEF